MRAETILLLILGAALLVLAGVIRRRSLRRAAGKAVGEGMARGPGTIQETPIVPDPPGGEPRETADDRGGTDRS